MDKVKVKYVREFQRNYSLFQVIAYSKYNQRKIPEFSNEIGIGHPLFVYSSGSLGKIYYPEGELKKIFMEFGKVAINPDYSNKVIDKFIEITDKIKPYFEKKKYIKSVDELRDLYELYLDFSYGEAAIWVIPLIEILPSAIREKAFATREKTESLTALRDELFDYNLCKLFPELGELTHFISPESVFSKKSINELKDEANTYKNGFVYFNGSIYTEELIKVLDKLAIELVDKIIPNKTFVKGKIASNGIATGRVKLVFTNEDISKVLKGDILVSPMTRPDFIVAMEKAAAIVTDEGGITSHAAIVSREMGIPCIVGTDYATEIFKDGDLIEVNANNGVVRKLEEGKV